MARRRRYRPGGRRERAARIELAEYALEGRLAAMTMLAKGDRWQRALDDTALRLYRPPVDPEPPSRFALDCRAYQARALTRGKAAH